MYCDTSKDELGCVLVQSERVVAYGSRQLKNHEQNYPTHGGHRLCLEDLAPLSIWGTVRGIFRPQKSEVYLYTAGP